MSPDRRTARVAGLLYLSTHVTSVAAVVAYSTPGSVLWGVALEVLLALGVLGTGVALLPLLSPFGPALAQAFSALRTLEAAVIAAGALPMLVLARGHAIDAGLAHALHDAAFLVGQGLVISVNTLVIAVLLMRSGAVPRWIGALGMAGGVLVLIGNTAQLLGVVSREDAIAGILAVPVFAFEISFAVCLLVRGVRPPVTAAVVIPARPSA